MEIIVGLGTLVCGGLGASAVLWILVKLLKGGLGEPAYRRALGLTDHQTIKVGQSVTSQRYGLQGYIPFVHNRGNEYIPVLRKRRGVMESRPWDRAQVIATCMLVEDYFGGKVPYGVLLLEDKWEKVTFDNKNREWVDGQLRRMRALLRRTQLPARPNKCQQCRIKDDCWKTFPYAEQMQ